jgi:hypothetical protein
LNARRTPARRSRSAMNQSWHVKTVSPNAVFARSNVDANAAAG